MKNKKVLPVPDGGLRVLTHTGIPLNVRFIAKGEPYGLDWCLTHEDERGDGPLVEFLGAEWAKECGFPHERWGSHISRYYAATLMTSRSAQNGLCLEGRAREFDVPKDQMDIVRAWITEHLSTGGENAGPRSP